MLTVKILLTCAVQLDVDIVKTSRKEESIDGVVIGENYDAAIGALSECSVNVRAIVLAGS